MKINNKIFSLPPHISTTWNNVQALHMHQDALVVTLHNGDAITIPDIKPELLEAIFDAHASFIEAGEQPSSHKNQTATLQFPFMKSSPAQDELPFKFGVGGFENFQAAMQHNAEQANIPNLPEEILEKIRSLSKILIPKEALESAPKGEPHCNCMYCQVARALQDGWEEQEMWDSKIKVKPLNDEISEIELQFQQWEIEQTEEKMYTVTNRLDKNEKYNVFLGSPVGCTCGNQGCEHILAVLKS